jgi:hypothetical protein
LKIKRRASAAAASSQLIAYHNKVKKSQIAAQKRVKIGRSGSVANSTTLEVASGVTNRIDMMGN